MAQSWDEPVKPTYPTRPAFEGAWVTPEVGKSYYIYNVGAAQFMGCGRDWGTRTITTTDSIVSPTGTQFKRATNKNAAVPYTISSIGEQGYVRFAVQNIDLSGFVTGFADGNASWQDGNDGRAANWQLIPSNGNDFLLHDALTDPYDAEAYVEDNPATEENEQDAVKSKFGVLGIDAIENGSYTWTDAWAGSKNGKSYKVAWKFVEASDDVAKAIRAWRNETQATLDEETEAYNVALGIYNARVRLYATLNEAVAAEVDYTDASAIYQKGDATVEEVLTANSQLLVQVKIATANLPVDITGVLQNPDFEIATARGEVPPEWDITITGKDCGQQNRTDTNAETGLSITNFIEAWHPSALGDGVIAQTVYGLPQGIYRLECDASICHDPANGDGSDIVGAGLFIESESLTKRVPIGTPRLGIDHFSVPFVNNDETPIQLGLYAENTNANWISADNFRLFYDGPLPNIYTDATEFSIKAGESEFIELGLNNQLSNLVAFQMDLTLPEGIGIDKTGCSLSSRITDAEQTLTIGKLENGAYRLTSSSLSLTPISGNLGELVTLKLTAEEGCVGGTATISNIRFSTADSERVTLDDTSFDISVKYDIIYKVDNQDYKTESIAYGADIIPQSDATREGYTFSGWSEIPETMPNHDVVVTGTFSINSYTLTYELDGEVYKSTSVVYGTAITPEEDLIKEGYTFSGWSEIPETMPAKDVTIIGSFTINSYTLTYELDGEVYKSTSVEYGTAITPEEDLTKEGYTFSGWSEIPETMPAKDVVVTGSFSVNSYTLTYKVDGEDYKTAIIVYGSPLTPETEPTKEGYTFTGWSEIPETMPAKDVVITGNFYLYGDVNMDTEVDVVDVVDIARYVVGTPSAKFLEKLADLNADDTVNLGDAVVLVNHIAGDQSFVKAMYAPRRAEVSSEVLKLSKYGDNISLKLTTDKAYTAFQLDLVLPEDTDIEQLMLNPKGEQKHQLIYNKLEPGRYRVAVFSPANRTFEDYGDELLSFISESENSMSIIAERIQFFDTLGNGYMFDTVGVELETGVATLKTGTSAKTDVYDLQGRKFTQPQRGVNIIRSADGTTRKVLVK